MPPTGRGTCGCVWPIEKHCKAYDLGKRVSGAKTLQQSSKLEVVECSLRKPCCAVWRMLFACNGQLFYQ